MGKWKFLPWRQTTAANPNPETLTYGSISTSKSGELCTGDINNDPVPVTPTGVVIPYAGLAPPPGWLICNGVAISRTTYANLFAVIGTKFGSGNGSTTFNLPDMRGRVAVGSDANYLAQTTGANTHVLLIEEMPSHGHALSLKRSPGELTETHDLMPSTYGTDGVWGFESLQKSGGGQSHNNMQPSMFIPYIIKL